VPPLLPVKTQSAKCGTKKSGKPKLKNMAFFRKGITATLPGILPGRVRPWAANPHTAHVLHYPKGHTNNGASAAHVFTISGNKSTGLFSPA